MITIKINIAKANITKNVKKMKEHVTSISNTHINNKDPDSSTLIKV